MKKELNENGFTLVEIVAVVVILGLIGLFVGPAVVKVIRGARKDVKEVNIDTVLNAAYDFSQKYMKILPDSTPGAVSEQVCAYELITCGLLKSEIVSGKNPQIENFETASFSITYCDKVHDASEVEGTSLSACVSDPADGKYFGHYLFTYHENGNVSNCDKASCRYRSSLNTDTTS